MIGISRTVREGVSDYDCPIVVRRRRRAQHHLRSLSSRSIEAGESRLGLARIATASGSGFGRRQSTGSGPERSKPRTGEAPHCARHDLSLRRRCATPGRRHRQRIGFVIAPVRYAAARGSPESHHPPRWQTRTSRTGATYSCRPSAGAATSVARLPSAFPAAPKTIP